ncbi:MAG: hypothetical protein ACI4B9_03690 [Eggerthellaceae bacterium]
MEISTVLTSAVVAAVFASVANIVIALYNAHRIKILERIKRQNELGDYRYEQLFNILLRWQEFDFPKEPCDDPFELAKIRVFNSLFENDRRFSIVSPLLDDIYKQEVRSKQEVATELYKKMMTLSIEAKNNIQMKSKMNIAIYTGSIVQLQ